MASDFDEQLQQARMLALVAEQEILKRFHHCAVSFKPDGSEVTDADRAAEQAMRDWLAREDGKAAIVGEEFGGSLDGITGPAWVLDPIDGTASFTLGVPLFGVLIAWAEPDAAGHLEPKVGVIHFPALGETVYAAVGSGCWFQAGLEAPRPVRVDAEPATLGNAVASACGLHGSSWQHQPGQPPYRVQAVADRARKFRFVPDCLQHALVARGRLHVAIDTIMNPWDIAALVPCVEEAGGVTASVTGRRADILRAGSLLSASTDKLHQECVGLLAVD